MDRQFEIDITELGNRVKNLLEDKRAIAHKEYMTVSNGDAPNKNRLLRKWLKKVDYFQKGIERMDKIVSNTIEVDRMVIED